MKNVSLIFTRFKFHHGDINVMLKLSNRPFPSLSLPPLQSESKCGVFVMVISSTLHMNEN